MTTVTQSSESGPVAVGSVSWVNTRKKSTKETWTENDRGGGIGIDRERKRAIDKRGKKTLTTSHQTSKPHTGTHTLTLSNLRLYKLSYKWKWCEGSVPTLSSKAGSSGGHTKQNNRWKEVMQIEENNRYKTNTLRSQEGVISLGKEDGLWSDTEVRCE